MDTLSLPITIGILIGLIFLSAFFSGSEASMLSLNRYRLKHLSKVNRSAKLVNRMLTRPDRLLGIILIGNNFANILASAIATMLAVRIGGEWTVLIASAILTVVLLIFAEISPKTVATLHPEKIAFPASYPLQVLLWLLYPLVWLTSSISNGLLKLLGITVKAHQVSISRDELKTMVNETQDRLHAHHRDWLLSILDLEAVQVNDIMVPKDEMIAINIANEWKEILKQLSTLQHTLLPVYDTNIENIIGMLHTRDALNLIASDSFTLERLKQILLEPYFIPEGTSLTTQLINFQKNTERAALVVDEYGGLQGLVTLADILEEIVGDFTTDIAAMQADVHPQSDGTTVVDGSVSLRDINRLMNLSFPTDGPKTLSGLIIQQLETIPETSLCLYINEYPIEIIQIQKNRIKKAKIYPPNSESH